MNYASLQNYNEDYQTSPTIHSLNYEIEFGRYHVYDSYLDGNTLEPETDSDAMAFLILILDFEKNGFFISLRIHHLKDMTKCGLYILKNQTVDREIIRFFSSPVANYYSGKLISKFIPFSDLQMASNEFIQYLNDENIIISISTRAFPNGEIDGIIKKVY